ncbi:aminotransferase class I/II-fold pyridoxal phosphate-dependent enzyme [Novosphingobium sp.]|uniref:aminotransferase class I/II-fold pyridoxal phosphate-dependent enzyme n=1 Tax=Novosphingobium sp. TaxID=1874826 RepID=UPI003D14F5FD
MAYGRAMLKPRIAQLEQFHAMTVSVLAHRLGAQGRSIIHMEYGQPSTGAPAAAIACAHDTLDTDAMGYWESHALKVRIARHYLDRDGIDIDPARVVLTCGASPALVMALSLTGWPGARVAFARPGYVAYRNSARALFMEPVEVPCGAQAGFQIDAAAIAAIDPAPDVLILASPANPTGTVIADDELARIAQVCAARGIAIIADEIYHGITFGKIARSVLAVAPDALIVNSFSKYFSMPGWRLGWLVVPPAMVDQARARMGNLFLTPPVLSQKAALVAFDCTAELESHVATYARNRDLLLAALPALGLDHIAPPDGAFYIYADVGHLTDDSLGFALRLLEDTGVAIAPGIDFDPVEGGRFVRFSFAVSTPLVEQAIARLVPWFAAQPIR